MARILFNLFKKFSQRLCVSAVCLSLLALSAFAQVPPIQYTTIRVRCNVPGIYYSTVTTAIDGNVTVTPCPLKSTIFNGIADFSHATVTGLPGGDITKGFVNFAAGQRALTIVDSTVTLSSLIQAMAQRNDATCSVKNVTASVGTFIITLTAACTASTKVAFWIFN